MRQSLKTIPDRPSPEISRRRLLYGALATTALAFTLPQLARQAGASGFEARLAELGVSLPDIPEPVANYVPYRVVDGFVYCAGQIPFRDGELIHPGKVPTEVSVEDAQTAARQCAINLIATLKAACDGNLDRVRQCMRLQGFVASADDFTQQSTVMNGASDFMVEVFGEVGRHTRLAVGVNTLPLNACVEVSGVFAIN